MYQGLLFRFMTFVDQNHDNADARKSQVKFQISLQGIEKPKKEIKVIFPPKFLQSFVVDGFDTCKHISFVEPNTGSVILATILSLQIRNVKTYIM